MTREEFRTLSEYVYRKTGIKLQENKLYYVERKVSERMAGLGFSEFRRYFYYLRFDSEGREFQELINSLTVNETYFFREYYQLKCFAEEALPEILERKKVAGHSLVKVWSAGCSTGEEPYTLAIILNEMLEGLPCDFQVDASDINTGVLEFARRGVYGDRTVRDVPRTYKAKYFLKTPVGWEVVPEIKQKVNFLQVNLLDKNVMRRLSGYDAIFCRNVLIYFDDVARREVALEFYRALLPGGFIFLGHSESMSRITPVFRLKKFQNAIIYQKPG